MMGALIPLVVSLAPEIGKWLFGVAGEKVTAAAIQAVHAITGTADDATALDVIGRDPDKAAQLRLELAKLAAQEDEASRQADLESLKARLGDIASARAQTVDLARAGSGVAWGAPAVSVVVLLTFGTVMWTTLTHTMPAGSEGVLNVLLGMLGTGFAAVTNYWLGSSAGSQHKTALLAMSQPPATASPREAQP